MGRITYMRHKTRYLVIFEEKTATGFIALAAVVGQIFFNRQSEEV